MAEILRFPLQSIKKRELTEELLYEEYEMDERRKRVNELRRQLGLPALRVTIADPQARQVPRGDVE